MEKVRTTLEIWNRKLDRIWLEEKEEAYSAKTREREPAGIRMAAFVKAHRADLLFVSVMGCLLFFLAWVLPFNEGPDEEMRYLIPQFIYRHGTLPAGYDPEVRNEIWGISYAFHPILPYIFGGYLMKLVGLFNSSEHALLMAARFINVLLGMGFYWYVLQLSKKLFARRIFRIYFVALLALLPQLLYLFVYVNTDGVALFSGAMLMYCWLEGIERRWDRRSCTMLAAGVAVCALSYFNAYGYALFSIVVFAGSLLVFYGKKGWKACAERVLKRGLYITAIVFLLSGWWFIRCAVIYDGDFLGLNAPAKYGELYAKEEFKPSVKQSVKEQGISLEEMLRDEADGGMEWAENTYRSTIGYFGFMKYPLGLDIYSIHKKLLLLGCLGILLRTVLAAARWGWQRLCVLTEKHGIRLPAPQKGRSTQSGVFKGEGTGPADAEQRASDSVLVAMDRFRPANFFILQFSFICCIIIPVLLSLIYSYTEDFQPQGRYVMPLIVPLMYFAALGTEQIMTLLFRKWFGVLLMIPLFYAVLHVFLSAFVSVYLPVYCEPLAFLESVRFPWFSNQGWLVRLLYLLIPG